MIFSNSNLGSGIYTRIIRLTMFTIKGIDVSEFRTSYMLHRSDEVHRRCPLHCNMYCKKIVPNEVATGLSFVLIPLGKLTLDTFRKAWDGCFKRPFATDNAGHA